MQPGGDASVLRQEKQEVTPYYVDTALSAPHPEAPWSEIYEVKRRRGDKLVCTCYSRGAARSVCRALNLGHAYGRPNGRKRK